MLQQQNKEKTSNDKQHIKNRNIKNTGRYETTKTTKDTKTKNSLDAFWFGDSDVYSSDLSRLQWIGPIDYRILTLPSIINPD